MAKARRPGSPELCFGPDGCLPQPPALLAAAFLNTPTVPSCERRPIDATDASLFCLLSAEAVSCHTGRLIITLQAHYVTALSGDAEAPFTQRQFPVAAFVNLVDILLMSTERNFGIAVVSIK